MGTDSQLLLDYARDRSQPAFDELVRRHLDLVYSAALRQVGGDAHAAQDVAQAVFLDVANRAGRLARHPSLRGWLYTATHFAASKFVRSERRRRAREEEAHAMHTTDAESPIDWGRLRPVLDDAMHELGERDRRAVLLRWFDQRSTGEIGETLGLSESAARRLTDRALERLRDILVRRGISSTSAALGFVLATQTVSAAPTGLAGTLSGSVAAQATTATAAPWMLTLMNTTKLQLAVLGVTAVLNLGIIRLAWVTPTPPPAPVVEQVSAPFPAPGSQPPFVAPAAPLVGDFSDPAFLAHKLWTEGYSETVIRTAVLDASRRKLEPEAIAIRRAFGINPGETERWKFLAPIPGEAKAQLAAVDRRSEAEANGILRRVLPQPATDSSGVRK